MDEMTILNTKSDAILWPVSLDGLCNEKIGIVLSNLYPKTKAKYMNRCLDEQLTKGTILLFNEMTPAIIIAPFKEEFLDSYDDEFISLFVDKINSIMKLKNIHTISIEKSKLTDHQIQLIENKKQFKVKLFNKTELLKEI